MNKVLVACAALIAGTLADLPSASAQILIDGFLDDTIDVISPGSPSSVITNDIDDSNISREISVEASGSFSIVSTVDAGFLIIDASGPDTGTANAEIDYLGFVTNLSNNTFFEFTVSKVVGTPLLGLILGDDSFGQISGAILLTPTETGTSYFLDITQFAGYTTGFGSELDSIQVLIGDTNANFFVQGNSFQFTSVPEPSSALLCAAGIAGVSFRRRKAR